MKKVLVVVFFVLTGLVCRAQEEDSCLGMWADVQVNHSFSENWYGSVRAEYRGTDNLKSTAFWFIRPIVGYKFTPWLKFDVGYDYFKKPTSLNHRALFSLTGTLKQGGLSVSVRERYIYSYNQEAGTSTNVLRSQLKAAYKVPDSMFKPYMAVELFTWAKWQKTWHFVGTQIDFNSHHGLDLFYVYATFDGKPAEHVIGIGYNLTI